MCDTTMCRSGAKLQAPIRLKTKEQRAEKKAEIALCAKSYTQKGNRIAKAQTGISVQCIADGAYQRASLFSGGNDIPSTKVPRLSTASADLEPKVAETVNRVTSWGWPASLTCACIALIL